jgi:DNA-binding NarL/FixJ family response regulator
MTELADVSATTRVLIAERQALVRAGLRRLLESQPRIAVVGEVATGEEALAQARATRPDLVLMSMSLPGADATETTRQIVADPALAEVRVLMLSASARTEPALDAFRAGATGVLLESTDHDGLVLAVRRAARGEALLSPRLTRGLISELVRLPRSALPSAELLDELTAREREVVGLVAHGLTNEQIAERLVVSPATAKTHVSRAMVKLGARDRAQLVVLAYEAGLVLPPDPDVADPDSPRQWNSGISGIS